MPLYRQVGSQGRRTASETWATSARRSTTRAHGHGEQALPLLCQVGDVLGEANCVEGSSATSRSTAPLARAHGHGMNRRCHCIASWSVLGEANAARARHIALRHSDHEGARARYEQALPLFRQVGDVVGEANCISGNGGVARAVGDLATAAAWYQTALTLYQRMHATQHIAIAHEDLARVTEGAERAGHVEAARAAWLSMDLLDEAERVTRAFV